MVEGKWLAPGQDLKIIFPIREAVFGIGGDEWDLESWNAAVFVDSIPCATGRIRYYDGVFLLESICVLPAYRRQGIGELLLRLLLFKARQHSARIVRLFCPESMVPFFKRYGFKQDSNGSLFLLGEDICLENCRGCGKCRR